jgi:hypothetical protein
MIYGFKVSKKYAIDFGFLYKIRSFKDGISFLEFSNKLDLYKGDHNPKLQLSLIVLNFLIFELDFYNVNHYYDKN